MSEFKPYKISETDFIKDEFDCLICIYNGYKMEISYNDDEYDDEYQCWSADAFDLEAQEYVFYPGISVPDKDKTRLNDTIQLCCKYIDEHNESKFKGNKNILIYIK